MNKQVKKIMVCLLLVLACLCGTLLGTTNNIIRAVSNATKYTNVLYDLQTDDDFDATDYVVDMQDYSLKVIQIAESSDKELFVYVYQPCSPNTDLQATSINISKGIDANLSYINYTLTLLNSNGVFYKYRVDDFRLETTATRYYDISSIFRKWYVQYDESLPEYSDNAINEVVFAVNRCYTLKTLNNQVSYDCTETETIQVESKHVGFVRYKGGKNFWGSTDNCDSHYVAFSTDKQIDTLLEADVYFQYQTLRSLPEDNYYRYGDILNNYSYITSEDAVFYQGGFNTWYNYSYDWQRIQTIEDFLEGEDFSTLYMGGVFNATTTYQMDETALQDLQDKQWVLRFFETEYIYMPGWYSTDQYSTIVSNVSILRLKFSYNGVIYNLGVIDNKQSGDLVPDNNSITTYEFNNIFKLILGLLLLILLLILLAPILPQILNFIWWLVSSVAKGIWTILSFPFKKIKQSKNKNTENKKGGGKT